MESDRTMIPSICGRNDPAEPRRAGACAPAPELTEARPKAACEAACDVLEKGRYGGEASYLLACVIAEKALAAADAVGCIRISADPYARR